MRRERKGGKFWKITTIKSDILHHTIVDEAVELLPSMADTEIKRTRGGIYYLVFRSFQRKI
jgi:hypothetical protein